MSVHRYSTRQTEYNANNWANFTKFSLKKVLECLISNYYFKSNPNGITSSSFHDYFVPLSVKISGYKNWKKINLDRAKRHVNVFRSIDDLTAINYGGEFELTYKEIYPLKLELKKESSRNPRGYFGTYLST